MFSNLRALSLSVLAVSAPALTLAQATAVQPPPHFAPMAFLVGHCWTGTFPDGKATDEHCFEWVYDGRYIRDRHVVRGQAKPYGGETLYALDRATKRVVFWYWNSNGGVSTGHVEPGPEGLVFPEKHEGASGTLEMKAVWKQTGPDSYSVTQSQKSGTDWKVIWTMEMKKK